jgi:hypothetical protein
MDVASIRQRHLPVIRRTGWCTPLALAVLLALSGCAGQGNAEADNVKAAADQFVGSLPTATATACGLLAPETRRALEESEGSCVDALPGSTDAAHGAVRSVEVYGKDAVVHLSTDTLFLARFPQGWRVTAAGCTRQLERPYDCKVRGG